ncbi:MAG: single-stranded DNA-binding protein [Actinomycetia bacterium]|nr:single-stranded DNA-binding protein [Actinomycetes bacterium]
MNSVFLRGRVATDPELEEVYGGSRVAIFLLAVEWSPEESDLFRIRFCDRLAPDNLEGLAKGREVMVEGMLRQDTYYPDGHRHQGVSIVARRIEYV